MNKNGVSERIFLVSLLFLFLLHSCHEEQNIPIEIDVDLHIRDDNHTSPLLVAIENKTTGANEFLWTFEGGEPAVSSLKNPASVRFTTPGEHLIRLEARNEATKESRTYSVRVDSAVIADFEAVANVNNYAPAAYNIANHSSGGSSYIWTFEGGEPASYEGQYPPPVIYPLEGRYTITLTIGNGSSTFTTQKEISVREPLDASFAIIPSFEDEDDMEAPIRATFESCLQGVESLVWICEGAIITEPESVDAGIYFPSPGDYTVYLEVSNGKEIKRISQNITAKTNTNLRTHKDIHLGINTSHEKFSVYYSTKLRRSFKVSEVNVNNGNFIDIVYFGLSRNFSYNMFVSPDQLSETTFPEIPNANRTRYINKIESGSINLTSAQFNEMHTDTLLNALPIASATYGDEFFTNVPLPRVVLFETSDKRKGAILIKEMISNEREDSYIIVDIKVQKND